jgi:hypothetical protein
MPDMDFDREYYTVVDLGAVKYRQDGMYFRADGSLFDGDWDTGRETQERPAKQQPKLTLPQRKVPSVQATVFGTAQDE